MVTTTNLLFAIGKGRKNRKNFRQESLNKSPVVNVGSGVKMLILYSWHVHRSYIMVSVVNSLGGQGKSKISDGRSEKRD